jgi:hypothetical protein
MIEDGRLPLMHPAWTSMNSFLLAAETIPHVLGCLIDDPEARFGELFPQVLGSVLHQDSISPAAYAAFPYLVQAHQALSKPELRSIVLLANVAIAQPPTDLALPADVVCAMRSAVAVMEATAVTMLTRPQPHVHAVYYTAVSALAFAGHCAGDLLSDAVEPDGKARSAVTCPRCAASIKISLFAEGAVPWLDEVEPLSPVPPRPLARLSPFDAPDRRPNPWRLLNELMQNAAASLAVNSVEFQRLTAAIELCRRGVAATVSPGPGFSLIGALLVSHGYPEQAMRFFRFADEIDCPHCQARFRVSDEWWGYAAPPFYW